MKNTKLNYVSLVIAMAVTMSAWSQGPNVSLTKKEKLSEIQLKRWSHLDLGKDSIPGMSIDRLYSELIKNKKGQKVIVGVLDSGVDIDHEDLKSVIWTNPKEIPGNGIDDDYNGYIDDVHGWNFLGNIEKENLELTRLIKKGDDGSQAYKEEKADYDSQLEKLMANKQQVDELFNANKVLVEFFKKEDFTIDEVKAIVSDNAEVTKSAAIFTKIGRAGSTFMVGFNKFKDQVYNQLNYNLNLEFDARKVLGDNPDDFSTKNYGNNIVYGPDKKGALHGTHVAGIIAQSRNNDLGGDGIANNVEIMSVRAVPNGDEYDKDVALAIRYAVDNGAKVINASFGKNYSPHKEWVYDAIKYAESKDVLIVHAAGNDSKDIDIEPNFPNDSDDKKIEFADNVITVGALNYENGSRVVANFSNYGKLNVDVFAPGVKIYATTPNNEYQYLQGTSMASPNVAGVAALLRSYFPNLTAKQIKGIIMSSGTSCSTEVVVGGNKKDMRLFDSLSKSGKMVNAYNAFVMAKEMSKKRTKFSKKNKEVKG